MWMLGIKLWSSLLPGAEGSKAARSRIGCLRSQETSSNGSKSKYAKGRGNQIDNEVLSDIFSGSLPAPLFHTGDSGEKQMMVRGPHLGITTVSTYTGLSPQREMLILELVTRDT